MLLGWCRVGLNGTVCRPPERANDCPMSLRGPTHSWTTSGSSRRGGRCSTSGWAGPRCRSPRCCPCSASSTARSRPPAHAAGLCPRWSDPHARHGRTGLPHPLAQGGRGCPARRRSARSVCRSCSPARPRHTPAPGELASSSLVVPCHADILPIGGVRLKGRSPPWRVEGAQERRKTRSSPRRAGPDVAVEFSRG